MSADNFLEPAIGLTDAEVAVAKTGVPLGAAKSVPRCDLQTLRVGW